MLDVICTEGEDDLDDVAASVTDLDMLDDWDLEIVVVMVVVNETTPAAFTPFIREFEADASGLNVLVMVIVALFVRDWLCCSVKVCVGEADCSRVKGVLDVVIVAVMVMLRLPSSVTDFVLERSRVDDHPVMEEVGDLLSSRDGDDVKVGVLEPVIEPLISLVGVIDSVRDADVSLVGVGAVFVADCCQDEEGVLSDRLILSFAFDTEIRRE